MTRLVEAKELPEAIRTREWPDCETAEPILDYEDNIARLGIAQRFYHTGREIQGKHPGEVSRLEWVVLTKDAAQLPRRQLHKETRGFVRELREAIGALDLPLRVHTLLVRLEGEEKLKDHLNKNGILYLTLESADIKVRH